MITPKYKLWFTSDDGRCFMGDGKWELLKFIDKEGSLKAASEILGMSYRKAWGELKKTENFLSVSLVDKHRGGLDGGKTVVTKEGKRFIKIYEEFRSNIEADIQKEFKSFIKKLKVK